MGTALLAPSADWLELARQKVIEGVLLNKQTVFAWLDADGWPGYPDPAALSEARELPAMRVWGDALVALRAEKRGSSLTPSPTIRFSALYGWITRTAPPAAVATARREHAIEVIRAGCAAARLDVLADLFTASVWRNALPSFLAGRGHLVDEVEEEIVVMTMPWAAMRTGSAVAAVRSTSPGLLADVLDFFGDDLDAYLDSWVSLADWSGAESAGSWEVVIPPSSVLSVVPF